MLSGFDIDSMLTGVVLKGVMMTVGMILAGVGGYLISKEKSGTVYS